MTEDDFFAFYEQRRFEQVTALVAAMPLPEHLCQVVIEGMNCSFDAGARTWIELRHMVEDIEPHRCTATTKRKERCRNPVWDSPSRLCGLHWAMQMQRPDLGREPVRSRLPSADGLDFDMLLKGL